MSPYEIVRPNGKVYRPRKGLRVAVYDNRDTGGIGHGIMVLGTHDIAAAVDVATRNPGDYECEISAEYAVVGWTRDGYQNNQRWWTEDPVRGAASVTFDCGCF